MHLYLTVPFVLSWSLLEAMAAGCSLVASATPPVQEVLENGNSALLVDFFDPEEQVAALNRLLDDPSLRQALAASAQKNHESIHPHRFVCVGWRPRFGAQHLGAAWLLAILTKLMPAPRFSVVCRSFCL